MSTLEELEARVAALEANQAGYRAVLAAVNALATNERVITATAHGPAPRPTIPMRRDIDAGTLLQRMRASEKY